MTDADLVLGYLDPNAVFGTSGDRQIKPRRDLAIEAVRRVAEPLGLTIEDAALGIVEIIDAKMANALERVVVGRGFDPRDFTILSYGGSGPVHAAGYARELGVPQVIIPGEVASVWSALGIGLSDVRYQRQRDTQLVSPFDAGALESLYAELEESLRQIVGPRGTPTFRRNARIRYEWQRNELEVGVPSDLTDQRLEEALTTFERTYESRYGSAALLPEAALEIVSLRVEAIIPTAARASSNMPAHTGPTNGQVSSRMVYFERGVPGRETQVYNGRHLAVDEQVVGPAVIDLPTTGIVVPPGATVTVSSGGNFVMTFENK